MLSRRSILHVLGVLAATACFGRAVRAAAPILTVDASAVSGRSTGFDLAALDALPQTRFRTTTPWTEGLHEFSGVLFRDCLAAAEASARTVRLIALNDYAVEADVEEMVKSTALLSTRIDGVPIGVEDKGPIFVIFPFDERADLRHQTYFSRSVWQLARIELLP